MIRHIILGSAVDSMAQSRDSQANSCSDSKAVFSILWDSKAY